MTDWRTDTLGATLQGASGAGKTTTARALHDRYPGPSIVFDLDEEPALGAEVRSVEELHAALARGKTEIVVRTDPTTVSDPDLFPATVQYLMSLGNHLRGGETRMQFIMGECQDLQEQWVEVAMKRFRKRNIKPVAETQDPFSLSKRIRTQAEYQLWLSPPSDQQRESLKTGRWPVEAMDRLSEHECLVLGSGWEPLSRFTAGGGYVAE